jgi:hypothetical protein
MYNQAALYAQGAALPKDAAWRSCFTRARPKRALERDEQPGWLCQEDAGPRKI